MDDVLREHTDLDKDDAQWLHRLVAEWQLLADLSFADLVLWVPERPSSASPAFRAAAQQRPTTGPTAYVDDLVGERLVRGRRPLVDDAFDTGRIRRDADPEWWEDIPARVEAIPVRRAGRVLGVVARTTNLAGVRTPSRLELVYLECAALLARMIVDGRFPPPGAVAGRGPERVGDGMIRLDPDGVVTFASPNAVSAYRRLGLSGDLAGQHLGRLSAALAPVDGPVEQSVEAVVAGRDVRNGEIDAGGVVLALRAIPLTADGEHAGAVVLCRDVSEVRRRERELISKDATIREIHHRVKNNLQTVAALLRLQRRRVADEPARAALTEAERRVATIALVHETLAGTAEDAVAFDEVAARLLALVGDVSTADATLRTTRTGSFGVLDATRAAPLAIVINELLQNAAEHGLAAGRGGIRVDARRGDGLLQVTVDDEGVGLPADFVERSDQRMGLQIVRTLVRGELSGEIEFGERPGGGARVVLRVPMAD